MFLTPCLLLPFFIFFSPALNKKKNTHQVAAQPTESAARSLLQQCITIIYMSAERLPNTSLEIALRRLDLCTYAVQEIHIELDQPQDPDSKADLILATEKLVAETVDLYQTVRDYVWGIEPEEDE